MIIPILALLTQIPWVLVWVVALFAIHVFNLAWIGVLFFIAKYSLIFLISFSSEKKRININSAKPIMQLIGLIGLIYCIIAFIVILKHFYF